METDPRDMLHVGQVSVVSAATASARAAFDDFKGHVSGDMQMVFPAMGYWHTFWVPKVGDHVTVLRLPNGNQEGFVLGTHYTAANLPQGGAEGLIIIRSADGANSIILDALAGTMSVNFKDQIQVYAKRIDVEAEKINLAGEVNIQGNLTVSGNISNGGNMSTGGTHSDAVGGHCTC